MKVLYTILAAVFFSTAAHAHEWTPTYPKFEPSFMDGVVVTTMKLFNKRNDARFYEISVYDADWNPIPFAASSKIVEMSYLETKNIDIYITEKQCDFIEYICTTSRLVKGDVESSGINTKICSKV